MMTEQATILVVDDLPQNVRLLDAILAPRGYGVVSAASGEEALDAVAEHRPPTSCCSTSSCPGWTGTRSAGACATIRRRSFLPVVMITANGDQEKVKAIEAGADDFIVKPFDQAELLARVRSLIRIKRYHDTIEAQAAELAELEPHARAARPRAGRRARADRPAEALPVAAARRGRHLVGRRVVPRRATGARSPSSSATCAASRRSPRRSSPRT